MLLGLKGLELANNLHVHALSPAVPNTSRVLIVLLSSSPFPHLNHASAIFDLKEKPRLKHKRREERRRKEEGKKRGKKKKTLLGRSGWLHLPRHCE
jgi:hypothetical protein